MRVHLRMYPAGFYCSTIQLQSWNETTQKHNYVSPSAENGPAMAGPSGSVPVPMLQILKKIVPTIQGQMQVVCVAMLSAMYRELPH